MERIHYWACQTLQHLVELYQGSLKETNNTKRSHETHFNDEIKETTTSGLYLQTPKCL
jgi:hypothetical protein